MTDATGNGACTAGGVTLAGIFNESSLEPDLILASDMLDLTTFLALTRERTAGTATAVYFHENQFTYPWSPRDKEAKNSSHYGFINYSTALCSDRVFFNSAFHMESFLKATDAYLKAQPDQSEQATTEEIRGKSMVLPLGMELEGLFASGVETGTKKGPPLLLWNHRWEYDKNPAEFFALLKTLAGMGLPFEVAILGEHFARKLPYSKKHGSRSAPA